VTEADRQKLRERAHLLWEQGGRPNGEDLKHWLTAECELRGGNEADPALKDVEPGSDADETPKL
jgi:hypothetical protein